MGITIPNNVTSIGSEAFGYYFSADDMMEKIPDFIIYGTGGSEAERYAKDNGFTFRLSSGDAPSKVQKNSILYHGKALL